MGAATLAGLMITLGLNSSALQTGLKQAKSYINSFTSSVEKNLKDINHKLDLMGRLGTGLHSIFQGVGIALGFSIWGQWERVIASIVKLLPSLIDKAIKFGAAIENLQNMTGATAETTSRFVGIQNYLGIGTEDLARRIGQLSRNVISHQKILRELGIQVKDSNGNFLDQITILDNVRSALSKVENGVTKTALEIALLGRGGFEMADYFELTDKQVALLNEELDNLGVTLDENAVQKTIQAERTFNLFGLAVQGLANTLFMDIAPALITAVDAIVKFVKQNGEAIAAFAAQVVNFVLGMISALTGATFATVTFTQSMVNAAGAAAAGSKNIDQYADSLNAKDKADKSGARSAELQIRAIDRQIDRIRELDREQQRQYNRHMDRIRDELNAQLDALDRKEDAFDTTTKNIDLAQQLEEAQRTLAMAKAGISASGERGAVNPQDVAQAQIELNRILREIGGQTMKEADDRERDRIKKVQDYLSDLVDAEKDAVNKKTFLNELNHRTTLLRSQLAAAKQAGDLKLVADLTTELEAVRTTKTRVQQEIRNTNSIKALEAEKLRLQDLKSSISSVVPVMETLVPAWNSTATQVNVLNNGLVKSFNGIATALGYGRFVGQGGTTGIGIAGAFDEARLAGMKFGKDLAIGIGQLAGALKTLLGWLTKIGEFFGAHPDTLGALLGLAGIAKTLGIGTGPGALATLPVSLRSDTTFTNRDAKQYIPILEKRPRDEVLRPDMGIVYKAFPKGTTVGQALATLYRMIGEEQGRGGGGTRYAKGGWAGLHGPELSWLGEEGPEFVVPADKTGALAAAIGQGPQGGGTLIVQIGAEKLVEIVDRRLWISRGVYGEPVLASGSTR